MIFLRAYDIYEVVLVGIEVYVNGLPLHLRKLQSIYQTINCSEFCSLRTKLTIPETV